MKYIKTFESKNYQVLYHYIPLFNLIKVFEEYKKTGKFYLKTDIALDRNNGKPVISLTRNANMNSVDLSLSKQVCRITLDASKLSTKFKLKPYADSTYTKGSDSEQEEMLFVNDISDNPNKYFSEQPSKFQGDVSDFIIQIDILTFIPEYRDEQSGYISWSNSYDKRNGRYLNKLSDQDKMQQDHEILAKRLFRIISDTKTPFKINIVKKFVNYKYQDRYIDRWNRRSFIYNKMNK